MNTRLLNGPSALSELFVEKADEIRGNYLRQTAGIDYEAKGILHSEMLFLASCLVKTPGRIIESGRARGQSTLILASCFPDTEIISIEHDRLSPDVPIADQRLASCENVTTIFGDSCKILADYVRPGDVVLIDGPKHFRAIRLCFRILQANKPDCVFLHDVFFGTPEREFLDKNCYHAVFSDHPDFVRKHFSLNDCILPDIEQSSRTEGYCIDPLGDKGYGPTLGCVYYHPECSYAALRLKAAIAGIAVKKAKRSQLRNGT